MDSPSCTLTSAKPEYTPLAASFRDVRPAPILMVPEVRSRVSLQGPFESDGMC